MVTDFGKEKWRGWGAGEEETLFSPINPFAILILFVHIQIKYFNFFLSFSHEHVFIDLQEREEGGERENTDATEKHLSLPPVGTLTRDRMGNLGLCPDRGWNPPTFGVQDDTPTTEPPRQDCFSKLDKENFKVTGGNLIF